MEYERWKRMMRSFGFSECEDTFNALVDAYSEKHRFYHTDEHINAVLNHLDAAEPFTNNRANIELALWFHDAIYKPFSNTNEIDSANWAANFLANNNASELTITNVHKLIMATVHTAACDDLEASLVVDIDLAILGEAENIYDKFEHNIRKEYKQVPAFLYKKKRSEILGGFLDRDSIYKNEYFYNKYEVQARENIGRALSMLSGN